MGIVHQRRDQEPAAEVAIQICPMGRRTRFETRPMAYACLNCGEWIHPGTRAWHDPDLDESLCANCWPETLRTVRAG